MSKVRVDAYISLPNFNKLEAVRSQTHDKGYTRILNHVITKYFAYLSETEHQSQMFTDAMNRKDEQIRELKFKVNSLEHPYKPEPTEENIKVAEKILEEKVKE